MTHATTITVQANLTINGEYTKEDLFRILNHFDCQSVVEDGNVRATMVITKAEERHFINH